MAEDANPKTTPEPKESISKPELAAIVRETKESREKEVKPAKIQIPANFTAALKALVDENKQQTSFLSKIYNKIEDLAKAKQEVATTPKEDTTGEEAAAALKEEKPQPVIIKQIDPKALEELEKIFKTLAVSAKGKSEATQAVTQTGGGGDGASGLFSKVFGNKLLPLAGGLAGALALAVGSWFNDGPFKGLMKEFGKLGTTIFGKKLALEAAKLFPSLIKFIKPIARKLPVIGTIIDFGSAISRIKEGDFVGGIIDLASGIANLVPGVGTAISIGLGFINAARDLTGQTEDAKKGEGNKEGSIFSILTQAVVKFAPKVLSKLKFLPVIGSLFSFASAFTNFKSGNIFKGLLDVVAGVAGFFPGVGTVVSLLASGVGLVTDLFGGEKGAEEDPTKAINVPKSSGGSLLSRLTKYLSDKFKDLMKGTLNFLKKLPFVPEFIIDKVSNFLGLNEKSSDQEAPAAMAPGPAPATPITPPAPAATVASVTTPATPSAPVPVATSPVPITPPPVKTEQSFTSQRRAARASAPEPDWLQEWDPDTDNKEWAKQYKRTDPKTWKIKPKINSTLGYISAQKQNDELARQYLPKETPDVPNGNIPVKASEPATNLPNFINSTPVKNEIPKGKTGGIFTGSKDGYLVELHGTEAVVPLEQSNNLMSGGQKIENLTENQITAAKQNIQLDDPKQQEYSMTYLVKLLKDYISEDNKDRYDPKEYERLSKNALWFEKQLKAGKEINEEMKKILYEDAQRASYTSEGKKSGQAAQAYTKDVQEAVKYENFAKKYKLINDWKERKDADWSSFKPVYSKNTTSTKARFGGVFTGPEDGYDMTLHGTEAVIPLRPDTRSRLPLESPLSQLPGMPGSELVEKIEALIETIKNNMGQSQTIDNTSVAGMNSVTGGATTTNIFQNSSERDIPYMERNKYRQKLIYSRGLI
jgi:hypothetical protein